MTNDQLPEYVQALDVLNSSVDNLEDGDLRILAEDLADLISKINRKLEEPSMLLQIDNA